MSWICQRKLGSLRFHFNTVSVNALSSQIEVLQASPHGPTLAVVAAGGALEMYDVSDASAAIQIPPYRTPGGAFRVSIKGTLAYVAEGRAGLQVLDLSTPSNPRVVGAYTAASPVMDVAATESLVFVVLLSGEVQILKQTP
jgi:hypothetical protein